MGGEICSTVKVDREQSAARTLTRQNVAIKSKAAKKVLDVCQDKDAFGTLIIYEDYKMDNQRFDIL